MPCEKIICYKSFYSVIIIIGIGNFWTSDYLKPPKKYNLSCENHQAYAWWFLFCERKRIMQDIQLLNGNCLELLKDIPDNSIDLIVTDPPYEKKGGGYNRGGGAFGSHKRVYHSQLDEDNLLNGISNEVLDEMVRVMKKINIYIWCNKEQLKQYIDYFESKNCLIDLLTWHKTNPVPTCNNKYLSDTEYILFFREKGVKVYGSYETKKKYYVTPTNKKDKELYKHPTIKPVDIINNLIINSSKENDVVLDSFMGSGTTGVACVNTKRKFIGIELNKDYFDIANKRIEETKLNVSSFLE